VKIVVAVKQVPARDAHLRIDASERWIVDTDLQWEMNEPDAYALEAGLQLKERTNGELVAISAGPDRVQQTLREALAKGADRAIHVRSADSAATDPLTVARLLAQALGPEAPQLVLTGLQSDDLGYGQTGVVLAEVLGWAHSTIIMSIEPEGDGSVRVKRELESGWYQHLTIDLPAVLTVQSGISKLRYATLMGIKRSKTKELRAVEAESAAASPGLALSRVAQPKRTKQTVLLDGAGPEAAAKLVEKLRFEARVL
jgi:electron transfer flavoprotein beta subunit